MGSGWGWGWQGMAGDNPADDETGGTFGPEYHGLATETEGAFFRCEGVDLSGYAGVEGTSTPYRIALQDLNGVETLGYIGAADAAETLGDETVTNGDNEAAALSWDEDYSVSSSYAQSAEQHHAGSNSAKVVRTTAGSGTFGRCLRDSDESVITTGQLYKVVCWLYIPSGQTLTGVDVRQYDEAWFDGPSTSTTDEWEQLVFFQVGDCEMRVWFQGDGAQNDFYYIDDLSIKQVQHVGEDGVHIVSSLNGPTRNWASIGSGFEENSATFTFQIWPTG